MTPLTLLHDLVDLIVAPAQLKAEAHDIVEKIENDETVVDHEWQKVEGFWAKVEKTTADAASSTAPTNTADSSSQPGGGQQVPDPNAGAAS